MPRRIPPKPCNIDTSPEHYEAFSWCTKNGIKVYPKWVKNELRVEIDNSNTKNRYTISKESYTNCESQQVTWDLYIKLYDKYKNLL